MSESLNSVGAITMFVEDRQRSKSFYEKLFDVEAIHEDENAVAFKFENLIVNLLELRPAHDLIDPAPVGRREAGSRFQLTIGSRTSMPFALSWNRAGSRCSTAR